MEKVKTDLGYVTGTVVKEAGKEIRVYKGIPYAAPPVGDLRWTRGWPLPTRKSPR